MDLASFTFTVVDVLSALTVAGQAIAVGLGIVLIEGAITGTERLTVRRWVAAYSLLAILIVSATATIGSLFFSEIAEWTPCKDCWFQRIFMYPQVLIALIALWKRDRSVGRYILALCLLGACFSLFHYIIQLQNIVAGPTNPATPCDVSGVSCVKTPFVMYGYVTIPMMALTAFTMNALISIFILLTPQQRAEKSASNDIRR